MRQCKSNVAPRCQSINRRRGANERKRKHPRASDLRSSLLDFALWLAWISPAAVAAGIFWRRFRGTPPPAAAANFNSRHRAHHRGEAALRTRQTWFLPRATARYSGLNQAVQGIILSAMLRSQGAKRLRPTCAIFSSKLSFPPPQGPHPPLSGRGLWRPTRGAALLPAGTPRTPAGR